jgi:hypothetical protein
VPWSSPSFLVYLGGLTIFGALASLLGVQADRSSSVGFVGWALLVFVLVTASALLARRHGHRVTAGLLALSSVAAYVVLLGALLHWFGWLASPTDSAFKGFRVSLLFLELSVVVAAGVALLLFRFPLLVLVLATGGWFFLTDLLSGGGDWSAVVTIVAGVGLFGSAMAVDRGGTRPYAFWLHVSAGLTMGGGLLWFFHHTDWDWIAIGAFGLLYIVAGDRLLRSSWVVLGAWGVLQATAHFAVEWGGQAFQAFFVVFYLFPFALIDAFDETGSRTVHPWAASVAFGVVGAFFVAIGLLLAHRRREAVAGAELL